MGIVHPGERNPNWRGGRVQTPSGYVLVRVGVGHHLADVRGYAYGGEQVHHVNGNKADNRPENIEVMSAAEHRREHRRVDKGLREPDQENEYSVCACGCGERFLKFDASGRPRRFVSGHNFRVQRG